MDVARYKYPPFWVDANLLWRSAGGYDGHGFGATPRLRRLRHAAGTLEVHPRAARAAMANQDTVAGVNFG